MPSVIASARKKKPGMPDSSSSGRKTTTLAAVEPISARAIRPVARPIATCGATLGSSASSRAIDSTTTMTSSMISPTAIASPPRVMRFNDRPARSMIRMVIASATGMIAAATSVVRRLRRKP
jgi:hypothetical protein